jgi:hypothetical protein
LPGEIGMLPSGGMKMANAMKAKSMVFRMLSPVQSFFILPVRVKTENNS